MSLGWSKLVLAMALMGAALVLSACQSRPGDHAYGRYPSNNDTLHPTTSDEDWFKDIGI
jgi:hypothetical protein